MQEGKKRTRVGIVGYGSLGKYLVKAILNDPKAKEILEIGFVWNRTLAKITEDKENNIPEHLILEDLGKIDGQGQTKLIY